MLSIRVKMPRCCEGLTHAREQPRGALTERVGEGVRVEMQKAKTIDRLTDGDLRSTRQDLRLPIQHDEEGIVARRDRELDRLVLGG